VPVSWTNSGVDLHLELPPGRGRRAALESALREAIREGRLVPGAPLPASRVLATQLDVSRGVVVEAYAQLVAEGYLRSRPGAVTEVAQAPGLLQPATEHEHPERKWAADLRFGRPDLSAFPRQAWVRALRRAMVETPHVELGPGDPRGSRQLRDQLAGYLGRVRGVVTSPDQIVICSGFSQGLRLACEALAGAGINSIGLEDPCLPDHRAVAAAAGLSVVPIEVDHDGARHPSGSSPSAFVLGPAHQAPLGATLATHRRVEFANRVSDGAGFLIEDDYDAEFRFDSRPVGALQGLAPESVLYIGTASKSLAPGLRLGWMVVPHALLAAVVEAKRRADRGTDVFTQLAFAQLVGSGDFDRHVRRMRQVYRRRRDALLSVIASRGQAWDVLGIAAGLHVVAVLPDGISEFDARAAAAEHSLAVTTLQPFWHGAEPRVQGIVVGYGTPYEHDYAGALTRFGRVMDALH
jgi:GntR family transcriptional regulator/MocR family aminotransferase